MAIYVNRWISIFIIRFILENLQSNQKTYLTEFTIVMLSLSGNDMPLNDFDIRSQLNLIVHA